MQPVRTAFITVDGVVSADSNYYRSLCRYVKLYVLPDKSSKLKTSVKRNTTDPIYNELVKVKIGKLLIFIHFYD